MPGVVPDHGKLTQAAYRAAHIGCTDVWFAPQNTAYNAAGGSKIGSWVYAGRIMPGSYKNDFSKEFFNNMTGLPATLKERFVTEVQGKIEFSLQEFSGLAYEIANGGAASRPIFQASPVATTVAASPAPAADQFALTSATGFAVGDDIEVDLSTGKEYPVISNISGATIDVWPKLSIAPTAADDVKKVDGWESAAGGSTVGYKAIRACHYADNDTGIITWSPKVSAEGIKDDFGDGKKLWEMPIAVACHGFTDANWTGPIVAKKFILNSTLLTALNLYT